MHTNDKILKIVHDIQKYSEAVPCGSAIFAVEKYLYDHLYENRKDSLVPLVDSVEKAYFASLVSNDAITDVAKNNADEVSLSVENIPRITLSFAEDLDIDEAYLLEPDKEQAVNGGNTALYRIVLPQKVIERILTSSNSLSHKGTSPCPYNNVDKPCEEGSCGSRSCVAKGRLKFYVAHELSHILDLFLNHISSDDTVHDIEMQHSRFAKMSIEARDKYLSKGCVNTTYNEL